PPDFRPGKRYPTVVHVHGGPEWAWWVGFYGSWHEWDQLLASHGVVVLLPNPRGSDGQGPDFVAANKGDWGGMDWQDILAGLDELVRRGVADTARLGIGGWSYGGFMTAWAVTHPGAHHGCLEACRAHRTSFRRFSTTTSARTRGATRARGRPTERTHRSSSSRMRARPRWC